MRHIFRLNKLFFLFFPLFLFSFEKIYDLNDLKSFKVISTKDSYKLVLKNQKYVDYQLIKGFKFFIPYFTKEFSLKVLRYNSIGFINGDLSMNPNFIKKLKINSTNLNYYITDYNSGGRELDYLLKYYTIPYNKATSLSIEAYNIPKHISYKLNRFIYFRINRIDKNNKLHYILYSFYLILDKQLVDKYVKNNFAHIKNKTYIEIFLNNIDKVRPNRINGVKKLIKKRTIIETKEKFIKHKNIKKIETKKEIIKPKKIVKKEKKRKNLGYKLVLRRFNVMKSFGYIYKDRKEQNLSIIENKSLKVAEEIQALSMDLGKKLNHKVLLNGKEIYMDFNNKLDFLIQKVTGLSIFLESTNSKCNFNPNKIDDNCFKFPDYFQNYIYFLIKQGKDIPSDDEILSYGNYKTFNDIGKYYFEQMEFQKAEIYLKKAYLLSKNKEIPAHNLGVLYSAPIIFDMKKAISYLKETHFDIDYYNLGICYYIGLGVKENDKMARFYFKKAKKIPFAVENLKIMDKYKIGK